MNVRGSLVLVCCVMTTDSLVVRGDEKRSPKEQIIKEIKLNRSSPVVFEKEIEPILVNKCNFCHSGNVKRGKLDLSSYEALMRGGVHGAAVVPGKSADSLLVKLCAKLEKPYMPPKNETPFTPEELALVRLWIDQGAKPPTGARSIAKLMLKAPTITPVLGVAIRPDNSLVVASRGNQIHVYDTKTGNHVRSLVDPKLSSNNKPMKAAHLSLVESLAFSPDGTILASGSFQEVKLWDVTSGQLRGTTTGFAERVVCLAFSPDGKLLAAGGGAPTQEGELKLLEIPSGKVIRELKDQVHSDTVFGVTFSLDGKILASGGADKFVRTYDVASGKFLKAFEGHTHHVMGVSFSNDGKLIASGGADNVVKVWDYVKGEQVRTINAHGKPLSSLQSILKTNHFITCAGDPVIKMWDFNGRTVRNFSAPGDYLQALAASADGATVAAGGQDGVVRLYNGKTGAMIKSLLPPDSNLSKKTPVKK